MANEEIASVNGVGHVRGIAVGNVTVTGLVQAVDAETGKLVVVSKVNLQMIWKKLWLVHFFFFLQVISCLREAYFILISLGSSRS